MAVLFRELATQPEEVLVAPEICCSCGQELAPKGKQVRGVSHLEGEVPVVRESHHCDECQSGLLPFCPPNYGRWHKPLRTVRLENCASYTKFRIDPTLTQNFG